MKREIVAQSYQELKTACSTILLKLAGNGLQHVLENSWSVVRSASLAKGLISKNRPSQISDSK
jgi:hypothetical protein